MARLSDFLKKLVGYDPNLPGYFLRFFLWGIAFLLIIGSILVVGTIAVRFLQAIGIN